MYQEKNMEGTVKGAGYAFFAGVVMIVTGFFQAFEGLIALVNGSFYARPEFAFSLNVSSWGWVHLIFGIILFFTGFAVFSGRTWARVIGIILAVLSALANFAFIPYYPLWSILVIALDIGIIWGLANYRPNLSTESY